MKKVLPVILMVGLLLPLSLPLENGAVPSPVEIPFKILNPANHSREEVLWFDVSFHPGDLLNPENFRIYRPLKGGRRVEVPSDYLPSSVKRYPSSPYVRSMTVVVKDRWDAGEEIPYILVAGTTPPVRKPTMVAVTTPPMILIKDGSKTWQISTSQTLLGTNVYVMYSNGSRRAVTAPLIPVRGNQLTPDQISFALQWGEPTAMEVEVRSLLTHVHLEYRDAKVIQWGYGATQEQIEHTDIISATLDIYIPSGEERVFLKVDKYLHERIYNHNGFLYEFSTVYGPDDRYVSIYGTEDQFRMYGRSSAPTWRRGDTLLQDTPPGERSSPALLDVDSDGDLDMLVGCSNGTIYLLRNNGTPASPLFSPPTPLYHYPLRNLSIAVGDMNGDGNPDIIIGESGGGVYIMYGGMGGGGGNTREAEGVRVSSEASPAVGDLNGDGILDMVVGDGERGLHLYWGRIEGGYWKGVKDDDVLYNLNHGDTQQPAYHPHPTLCDTDGDGDLDLIIGEKEGDFGAVSFYYNTGDREHPVFRDLYPAMFNNVRGGNYIAPTFADLQGDGLPELIHGSEEGWIRIYNNTGNSSAERHVNTMQPLENGSYRFYWDKDGNDGQYVIRGYQKEFFNYYVLATPKGNHATLTYLNNYLKYVHRDRYYGDLYPGAGGNVSYYPFIPEEDGYVTRGILITSVFKTLDGGGMGGGSFISQTGTASGFIQVPLEAGVYHTDYSFFPDLPYDDAGGLYSRTADLLSNPLRVVGFLNIALNTSSISFSPAVPSKIAPFTVSLKVKNPSSVPSGPIRVSVSLEGADGDPVYDDKTSIRTTKDISSIPPGSESEVSVEMPEIPQTGRAHLVVTAHTLSDTPETDVEDNTYSRYLFLSPTPFSVGGSGRLSRGPYNSVSTALVEDGEGVVHALFSEYTVMDRYDLVDRKIEGGEVGEIYPVREGGHICVDGAAIYSDEEGLLSLFPSNINELNDYLRTRKGIYYWSEKFDLWSSVWNGDRWGGLSEVTQAEKRNDSDQDPDLFTVQNSVWCVFRRTHLDLYTNGHQMDNVPFLDYRIVFLKRDGGRWIQIEAPKNGEGTGWWRGPQGAPLNGIPAAVYEKRGGDTNAWNVYLMRCQEEGGVSHLSEVQVTSSNAFQVRPEIVSLPGGGMILWEEKTSDGKYRIMAAQVDVDGNQIGDPVWVSHGLHDAIKVKSAVDRTRSVVAAVYEGDVDGQKEVFLSLFSVEKGVWYGPFRLTSSPRSDEEPDVLITSRGVIYVAWERTDEDRIRRAYYTSLLPPLLALPDHTEVKAGPTGEAVIHVEVKNTLSGSLPTTLSVSGGPFSASPATLEILPGTGRYVFHLRPTSPITPGSYRLHVSLSSPSLLLPAGFDVVVVVWPTTNHPPIIENFEVPDEALVAQNVTLKVGATDPDGDEIFIEWWATDGTFPEGREGSAVQWVAPGKEGYVDVGVNVTDVWGGVVKREIRLHVRGNSPPLILYFESDRSVVEVGRVFSLRWGVSDPDGDRVVVDLSLPIGIILLNEDDRGAILKATSPGFYTVTIHAYDPYGGEAERSLKIRATTPPPPPNILNITFVGEMASPGDTLEVRVLIRAEGGWGSVDRVIVSLFGINHTGRLLEVVNSTDSVWVVWVEVPVSTLPGRYTGRVYVRDVEGRVEGGELSVEVMKSGGVEVGGEEGGEGFHLTTALALLLTLILVLFTGIYLLVIKWIRPRRVGERIWR